MESADYSRIVVAQKMICGEYSAEFVPSPPESKLGFALVTKGKLPINGLRHPVEDETNGWYIWCGSDFSDKAEFFSPLHTSHLYRDFPELISLLGLAPGYRFLLTPDHLDVWFDGSLLTI
jgi:hypothetical protein